MIVPNPTFEVNFTIGGDKTRQAVSKYMSSKAEIYEYLNQLNGTIAGEAWTFTVDGEEI